MKVYVTVPFSVTTAGSMLLFIVRSGSAFAVTVAVAVTGLPTPSPEMVAVFVMVPAADSGAKRVVTASYMMVILLFAGSDRPENTSG